MPRSIVKDAARRRQLHQGVLPGERHLLRLPSRNYRRGHCRCRQLPAWSPLTSTACSSTRTSSYYAISPPPGDWDELHGQLHAEIPQGHPGSHDPRGDPGHYVQLEYSNRHPSLIGARCIPEALAEGSAGLHRADQADQGYGDGYLALRLNQSTGTCGRSTNAILDYKIMIGVRPTRKLWSLSLLRAYSVGRASGVLEHDPGETEFVSASTYFVGWMAFQRLRLVLQVKLGECFELGGVLMRWRSTMARSAGRHLVELVGHRLQMRHQLPCGLGEGQVLRFLHPHLGLGLTVLLPSHACSCPLLCSETSG